MDLNNVFREIYPEKNDILGGKRHLLNKLDFLHVSESLIPSTLSVEYENSYRSNHSPVLLSLKINNFVNGTGFWKFNNSLLTDKEYVELIKKSS